MTINLDYLKFLPIIVDNIVLRPYEYGFMHENEVIHRKNKLTLDTYQQIFSNHVQPIDYIYEIGVSDGGSLILWSLVFPSYKSIVGIDSDISRINPIARRYIDIKHDMLIEWIDLYDKGHIIELLDERFPLGIDLVIDDGAHDIRAMIINIENCLHRLNPGGLYVIEDWMALHPDHQSQLEEYLATLNMSVEYYPSLVTMSAKDEINIST